MSLSATLIASFAANFTGPNGFASSFAPTVKRSMILGDGTGAGQADRFYADTHVIADGGNLDLDLSGGIADVWGQTITAVELVALLMINAPLSGAANTTAITIGAGSAPFLGFLGGTTPTLGPFQPGGVCFLAADHASGLGTITAATADVLRFANGAGAAATVQIAMALRSA